MKFFAATLLLSASLVAAFDSCPHGLYSNPTCCSDNVLGVIGLDCSVVKTQVNNIDDFRNGCSSSGKQPLCCAIPVAGQNVLCTKPVGV